MILENPKAGSHLVPLTACLVATTGHVLEVGLGDWSTPFLTRYCIAAGRRLLSVDDQTEWVQAYNDHAGADIRLVHYNQALPRLALERWSVVLVDHWPAKRRMKDAMLFRTTARHILIHDALKVLRGGTPAGWVYQIEHDTLVLTNPDVPGTPP